MVVRGVARGGPIMCLAYVVLMMFLPMFQLDCGIMTFDWTGVQLVTGSSEPLEAMGNQMEDMMGPAFEELETATGEVGEAAGEVVEDAGAQVGEAADAATPDLPKDWLVLALPGLAVLGIVALLARKGAASAVLIALLIAAFAYFTVRGFELERMLAQQIAEDMAEAEESPFGGGDMMGPMGDMEVGVKKAAPFWLGFGAAGLGLLLLFTGGGGKREQAG